MTQIISERLKLFLALSRTPHGIVDMAAPALAALLCLGHFPSLPVVLVGMLTVFAGYTAVYALNDLVDFRVDKEKVEAGGYGDEESYLDGAMTRHPLAKGVLRVSSGLAWACGWAGVAVIGAYWLNPVCLYLFVAGCVLEGIYCKLLHITPFRSVINGVVKTLGAMAAVFAVDPSPSAIFLIVLFCWIFAWEIGGQNIPNDWTDIEEDRRFRARTIPIRLGLKRAGLLALLCLTAALFLNLMLFWASPLAFGILPLLAAAAVNVWLLLYPAMRLVETNQRRHAIELFTKASHYPLFILVVVLVQLAL